MNFSKRQKGCKCSLAVICIFLVCILGACGVYKTSQSASDSTIANFVPQQLGKKPAAATNLTVGLIQFAFKPGDVEANIIEATGLVDEAATGGAELVVLPELWSIGYGLDDPAVLAESQTDGKTVKFMRDKAKEYGIYICGGYPELGDDGLAYDSAVLIDPKGEVILNHRKVELYTPLGEDKVWAAGNRYDVVDTTFGRVGILICYDGDFPEPWRIEAANKNADLIIHPTAYESPCETAGWWDKLYEAGAMQNSVWLISANMVGQSPTGSNFFGGSRVIDPMGNTLKTASFITASDKAKSEVLLMTLDFAKGLDDGELNNGSIVTDRKLDVFRANGL